jgi:hypothetical protein
MNMKAKAAAADAVGATVARRAGMEEQAHAGGVYKIWCHGPDGAIKWFEEISNVVCTEGKNLAFGTFLAGTAYTVIGPFMGLISSVGWTQTQASDTGAQINGTNQWKEAGGTNAPPYSGNRQTCAWAAASGGAIALSSNLSYSMTGAGTLEGAFVLYGTGATATKDSAAGVLWSAGTFSGGAKTVGSGDTVTVSYSTSM